MTIEVSTEPATPRTFDEQLGEAIHQVLWRRRIKQGDFAGQVLGITQSALSQKLRGKRPFFAGELSAISAWLGVPVGDLLPEVEFDPPDPHNGGDGGGDPDGAPTRARTWDLRIIRPVFAAAISENQDPITEKAA